MSEKGRYTKLPIKQHIEKMYYWDELVVEKMYYWDPCMTTIFSNRNIIFDTVKN